MDREERHGKQMRISKMNSLKLGLASALGILVIATLASASLVFAQMGDNPTNSNTGSYGVSLTCDFSNLEREAYGISINLEELLGNAEGGLPEGISVELLNQGLKVLSGSDYDINIDTEKLDLPALFGNAEGGLPEGISVELLDQGLKVLSGSRFGALSDDDLAEFQAVKNWFSNQPEAANRAFACLNNLSDEDKQALANVLIGQDYFPIVATQLNISEEDVRSTLNEFVTELMEEEDADSDFGISNISETLSDLAADMGVSRAALIGALGEAALVLGESYEAMDEVELIKLMVSRVAATGLISSDEADAVSQWIDEIPASLLEDGLHGFGLGKFGGLGGFGLPGVIELDSIGGFGGFNASDLPSFGSSAADPGSEADDDN